MGSLKDEMRALQDDKACEKTDEGERAGSSDGNVVTDRPQIITSQEPTNREDYKPELHVNVSDCDEEQNQTVISKDEEISGAVCDNADRSDSAAVKTTAIPVIQQPGADETTTAATPNDMSSQKVLSDGDGHEDDGITDKMSMGKDTNPGTETEDELENIFVPVPLTPGFTDPRSPAPAGQQHMRTQVSLEVVQCCSAATSPMTPPEGGNSFFFPSSVGRYNAVGTDTKDAELQVGHQVEFCSVATSPMTPKTPFTTAFPELIGKETLQKDIGQQKSSPALKGSTEGELGGDLKVAKSEEREESSSNASPESSSSFPAAESQATLEDSTQQCKQQRMGSMDQDITIMVTHYGNNEQEEEEPCYIPVELEMAKIDEYEEGDGSVKLENRTESDSPDPAPDAVSTNPPKKQTGEVSTSTCNGAKTDKKCNNSAATHQEPRDISTPKSPVPESPAPFGCHNIRTQVSLEVVQCQSVATSPMTPPEGDHAFYFPSTFGKCATVDAETKDAELQVGHQVECRSVATAPMTPRTPTVTVFPEIRKERSIEEKIVEEEEDKTEQMMEDKEEEAKEEEEDLTEEADAAEEEKEEKNCKEKCEEPVQEVSWDEKGMTWEVYGAVVEVTVLGSAIQKHLEKQVKKRQPSMPPPPPLNPSAVPLTPEESLDKGRAGKRREREGEVSRRRRNPFRLMMENMQQPHCCSKAHTTE
ncbi:uncharacterized protein V6R79_018585 [Siganus canaliculatus]